MRSFVAVRPPTFPCEWENLKQAAIIYDRIYMPDLGIYIENIRKITKNLPDAENFKRLATELELLKEKGIILDVQKSAVETNKLLTEKDWKDDLEWTRYVQQELLSSNHKMKITYHPNLQ